MKKKFKFFLFAFVILFVLFVLAWTTVNKTTNPLVQSIKSIIPQGIKTSLKKNIFSIPILNQRTERHEHTLNQLRVKIEQLNKTVEYLSTKFELPISKSRDIKSKSNSYNIRNFPLPYPAIKDWDGKPVAYLEQYKNKIVMASGAGEFYSFEKEDITSDIINLKKIKSNIKNLIKNDEFFIRGSISIKDLLILDNKIFFSFSKEQTSGCYNTSIMNAEFNLNYLNFSEFFSYEDCVIREIPSVVYVLHSGGKMVSFKNGKILLTIGEYKKAVLAQDKNSIFGKINSYLSDFFFSFKFS